MQDLIADIRSLQRQRQVVIKSRIMQANRLQAIVAGTIGYTSTMPGKERTKMFTEAGKLIKAIEKGADNPMRDVVLVTNIGIKAFTEHEKILKKMLDKAARELPVAAWVEHPDQKGFGLLGLATVIGETGDLNNYANPAKVWKRMGCAPHTFDGKTLMGKTWRCGKEGKLPSEEWENFGYSPRRRSIAYNIGEPLIKLNFLDGDGSGGAECANAVHAGVGCPRESEMVYDASEYREGGETQDEAEGRIAPLAHSGTVAVAERESDTETAILPGPYRLRYQEARETFSERHGLEVTVDAKGKSHYKLRADLHGKLLATKLLLKNLWIEWRAH